VTLNKTMATMEPPNDLAFSRRERAGSDLQKTNDRARAAVGCNLSSDTPYVSTAETALTVASSATMP
jgi:hypothetical protein